MSKTVRLRILIDTDDESTVFRDIEVPVAINFEQLHFIIQKQFGFDASEMASFYETDDNWERGDEIALMDMGMGEGNVRLMSDTALGEVFLEKGQKMLYIYDFLVMWTFFVEVVDFGEFDPEAEYPLVHLSIGEAPDPASKTPDKMFGAMQADKIDGEEDEDDSDDRFPDPEDYY